MVRPITLLVLLLCALLAGTVDALGPLFGGFSGNDVPASTGIDLLYQNDLNWAQTSQHKSQLLLRTAQTFTAAKTSCDTLSEDLAEIADNDADLRKQFSYLIYRGTYASGQNFWVGNDGQSILKLASDGSWSIRESSNATVRYPVLCTQSAKRTFANETDTSDRWQVSVGSGPTFIGYRDGVSFRFGAIPYAQNTQRFTYSTPSTNKGVIDATAATRGKQCPQTSGTDSPWAEQCLVLNLFTPTLPGKTSSSRGRLRPVMVWIHGGGFNAGSGLDDTFDGGLVASRGDVVVININYRLGSLGFLATGNNIKGNFGFADIITALKWVKANVATFGGDPSKVTVAGQSAGAQLVELLIGAPDAAGLFQRAIIQSGRPADSHNTFKTIAAVKTQTDAVVKNVGCDTALDVDSCLRTVPTDRFLSGAKFSSPVVDGAFIRQSKYVLSGQGGSANRVPAIIGYMRDEKASLGYVPPATETDLNKTMRDAGIPIRDRQIVLARPAVFSTSSIQNTTVTVETNNGTVSRCGLSATAYSAINRKVLPKVWAYTQDQRAYQIPNYDPYAVCQPSAPGASAGNPSSYYFCHSGDLLPTFGTAGYMFHMNPRDSDDVTWVRNQIDQWTSFIRTGDPNPASAYTNARGYGAISGDYWPSVSGVDGAKLMSLGPRQRVVDLRQHREQCEAIGLPVDYIVRGG